MKRNINFIEISPMSIKFLLLITALVMAGCSTVRDATDWVPGVDSNEEIQQENERQQQEIRVKEREIYEDKMAFEAADYTADSDAMINVSISQKYASENIIQRGDIGIEVNAGVVTLTGSVDSDESAIRAISIAKSAKGVAKVISKLVVINLRTEPKAEPKAETE